MQRCRPPTAASVPLPKYSAAEVFSAAQTSTPTALFLAKVRLMPRRKQCLGILASVTWHRVVKDHPAQDMGRMGRM
jgi:hypothetical protein